MILDKRDRENAEFITVEEMRAADKATIEGGIPSKELMLRAANGVYDSYDGWQDASTLIVCGSGNNAGDGYALATIIRSNGGSATLLRVSDKFSEDGKYYFDKCMELGIDVLSYADVLSGGQELNMPDHSVIVDCMLGTGFQGEPRPPYSDAIKTINSAHENGSYVISVDINSGMNGNTGEAILAVESDLTVSIGYYKKGFLLGKADKLIGKLMNVDIGIRL